MSASTRTAETSKREIKARIRELTRRAESGEQWAEICRLEALLEGGPFYG